jgi:hypothetical protein
VDLKFILSSLLLSFHGGGRGSELSCASLSFSCNVETFAALADESVMTQTVKKRYCMIDNLDNDCIVASLCSLESQYLC